jgi:hypothetical protein
MSVDLGKGTVSLTRRIGPHRLVAVPSSRREGPVTGRRAGLLASLGIVVLLAVPVSALAVPPNDDFANATTLPSVLPTSSTGTNVAATAEMGENTLITGEFGGSSVWWQWTAPSSGPVMIDTCGSNFDTLLGVLTGATVSTVTPVATNNDSASCSPTSQVSFTAAAGTLYRILVDGRLAVQGTIALHLAAGPVATAPTSSVTGQRAAALEKCKKLAKKKDWTKKRLKKCKKRARLLPI